MRNSIRTTPIPPEKIAKLGPSLRANSWLPPFVTYLGCGFGIRGFFRDSELSPLYFGICWIMLLQLPLIPLRIYLLNPAIDPVTGKEKKRHGWGTEFSSLGSISFGDFYRIYRSELLKLIAKSYLPVLRLYGGFAAFLFLFAIIMTVVARLI
jgi:hypothetical protein